MYEYIMRCLVAPCSSLRFSFWNAVFSLSHCFRIPNETNVRDCCAQRGGVHLRRRLSDVTKVPFVVTVPGTTFDGTYSSLSFFLANYEEVANEMGVDSDQVSFFLSF